jgi:hypothetical protein
MKRYTKSLWFEDYAVLGDDIVIADKAVAKEYLRIMSELGVGIGLAKSLVSHKETLEFAKRYIFQGKDCSPIPLKEYFSARGSISGLIQFGRKFNLKLSQLLDIREKGFRVKSRLMVSIHKMPRSLRNLILMAYAPIPGKGSIVE